MSIDVAEWLNGLGLERYEPAFRENEIDREALPKLTAEASNFAGDSAKAEGSAGQHARTSGRSASSTNAFPCKVDGFLTRLAMLCARKGKFGEPSNGYTSSQDSDKDSTCGT